VKKSLTLIIAVYNGIRGLEFIFSALRRQSFSEFEVIIADDGSGPKIGELVNAQRKVSPFPVNHLWHQDEGFRKNAMLNKAIQASQTDYAVFIDGDCIPHHEFLSDHWSHRREKALLCGRRVNLGRLISDSLSLHDIQSGKFERLSSRLWLDGLFGRSTNVEESLRLSSPIVRKLIVRADGRILGCNFSVERKWLEEINGFNEEYHAPGRGEDSDIAYRLGLLGVEMVSLRYLAILYHLYHSPTPPIEENKVLYERMVARREIRCMHGIRNLETDPVAFPERNKS